MLLVAAVLACSASSSAQPSFDRLEDAETEPCRNDGQWVSDAAVRTYFKDSYYDLDVRFRAFIGTARQKAEAAAALRDEQQRAEQYAFLHEQIKDLIPRMGRLLPRMERPLDLKPMVHQTLEGIVWDPRGNHHTEFLRVAFARQMLNIPSETARDPGPRIAAFLTYFSVVEDLLLTMKSGEGDEKDLEALDANLTAMAIGWRDGFLPIIERAIFASSPDAFAAQLAEGIQEICDTRLSCSSDSLDAPMECAE